MKQYMCIAALLCLSSSLSMGMDNKKRKNEENITESVKKTCTKSVETQKQKFERAAQSFFQNGAKDDSECLSLFHTLCIFDQSDEKIIESFGKITDNSQKYSHALIYIGDVFQFGRPGVRKNYTKAMALYEHAKSSNNPEALFALGSIHASGGCDQKQDFSLAFDFFIKASEQNHGGSMFELGRMFYTGVVCEPNIEKAMEYFEKGCWVSHELSAHALINILNLDIHTSQEKDTLFNLAVQVFENLGKYNKAMIFLEERMDINDHELHQNNLLNLLNRGFIKGNQDCMDFIISNIEEIEEWIIDDEKGSQSTLQQSKEREDIESLEYEILLQYIPDVTPETTLAECGGKIRTFLDKFNIQDDENKN